MQEIIQLFAALLGSLGFAVLFNIRGEKLVFAALGGLLSWGVYLGAGYIDNNPYFCGFTASVLLTLYAECMARVHKTPVTVFLVSAAIPLIPGAGPPSFTKHSSTVRSFSSFTSSDFAKTAAPQNGTG